MKSLRTRHPQSIEGNQSITGLRRGASIEHRPAHLLHWIEPSSLPDEWRNLPCFAHRSASPRRSCGESLHRSASIFFQLRDRRLDRERKDNSHKELVGRRVCGPVDRLLFLQPVFPLGCGSRRPPRVRQHTHHPFPGAPHGPAQHRAQNSVANPNVSFSMSCANLPSR